MKKFLLCLALICSNVSAQVSVGGATTPPTVTTPTFYDDTYVHVPLQFGFPFYGRTFTNSWMHSNGLVSFLDPAVPIEGVGFNPGAWAYCCGDRPTTTRPEFSYMIAPLWTDLYPTADSTFRTEGTTSYQKYFWTNLGEISNTANKNTFSLEIRPSGFIGVDYTQISMMQQAWIGTVGNPSAGQVNEIYYGSPGINFTGITGWSQANTPADMCYSDPLSSPSCPGYASAYLTQQCAANPLYNTQCPGYAAAYYTQQCSVNPLFDTGCPGYASAYLDYQCSINPLYSTTCQGYEQAYFDQQCALDALYNSSCPGYTEAYALANVVPSTSTPTISVSEPTVQISTDGTVSTAVSTTGDATVDSVIRTETTSTTSATATVQLASSSSSTTTATTTTTAQETEQTTEAKTDDSTKEDTKKESTEQASSSSSSKSDSGESKTKSARAETRQQAIAKAGKQAAENMDSAASLQAQVAVQGVVIAAMGYTPGFDAYKFMIPDAPGYKPFEIYKKQKNVDNGRMLRGLTGASDKLHEQMTDQQY
jgi:hypothetical protein